MANFLALIRKADFIDLFKYGSIHVNKDVVRQFSCNVEDLPKRQPIFDDVTFFANAFDSTFAYLFIHYEIFEGRSNDVNIADVKGIYPLDREAKVELSLSLDPRIKIHEPLWENAIVELQKKMTIQNSLNGVSNIWKIYHLTDSMESISKLVGNETIKIVVDELYGNHRPYGKLPVWVYIIRYERHAFYPDNTLGAFMDAVNAILNYKNGKELDADMIESEMIMQFLYYCQEKQPNMNFLEVLSMIGMQSLPAILDFLDYANGLSEDVDVIKVAALFFIYRNRYKEGFKYEKQWDDVGKKNGKDFSVACYLLGIILGHEHTYDCLYEHLPLPIFKGNKDVCDVQDDGDDEVTNDESNKEENDPEETLQKRIVPKLPCIMGLPAKRGGFKKNPKPREVFDMDTYLELENNGWKEIIKEQKLW